MLEELEWWKKIKHRVFFAQKSLHQKPSEVLCWRFTRDHVLSLWKLKKKQFWFRFSDQNKPTVIMMDGFTIFMAIACLVSLFVIAFLITIFVILCIRTVDPSLASPETTTISTGMRSGLRYRNNVCAEDYEVDFDCESLLPEGDDECCGPDCCYHNSHKADQALLDHMYPTSKTSIIGKEVGDFELMTSANV